MKVILFNENLTVYYKWPYKHVSKHKTLSKFVENHMNKLLNLHFDTCSLSVCFMFFFFLYQNRLELLVFISWIKCNIFTL